ncbi:MAG: hypothetical protein OEY36_00390 [Gammaproteobacteria bacterium]|nr:hypothetical protein [Gammaproteobacteria bacterium]
MHSYNVNTMSDCCSTQNQTMPEPKHKSDKQLCPVCANKCLSVEIKTMLQHIKSPWQYSLTGQQPFFYCSSALCDVVYFSTDGTAINKPDIRQEIGVKEKNDNALICFCFGVTKAQAASDKKIKEFVVNQTRLSLCACDTSNPSGRCCLKDFPTFK